MHQQNYHQIRGMQVKINTFPKNKKISPVVQSSECIHPNCNVTFAASKTNVQVILKNSNFCVRTW